MNGPRIGEAGHAALALGLIAVVTVLDHYSGIHVRIYPLYFVAIALGCRGGSKRMPTVLPLVATLAWMVSNIGYAPEALSVQLWLVNSVMQCAAFLTVGLLMGEIRRRLEAERQNGRLDALTGLANTRAFHESGEMLLANAARNELPLTVAYIDLDNFKAVNDTYGHLEGDRVLKAVAGVLRADLRRGDLAARLGGDEFAILLSNTDARGAAQLLERLRTRLGKVIDAGKWQIGLSIGAVSCARAQLSLSEALQRADALMYTVKRSGKNGVHVEEAALHMPAQPEAEAAPSTGA